MRNKDVCPICKGPERFDHTIVDDERYKGPEDRYVTVDHDGAKHNYEGCELCYGCWCIHWHWSDAQFKHADKYTKLAFLLKEGWKQTEIARALGVHRNTVGEWKRFIRKNIERIEIFTVQKDFPVKLTKGGRD